MTTATGNSDYVAGTKNLDPSHSEVSFSVKHLMISKVRGTFDSFDVTITSAPEARDAHLRTSDFFQADEHPTMTFNSTLFDGDAANGEFTVVGNLTLRGITREVTLLGEFGGVVSDGYGNTKAGATATTTINRQDFGVAWNAAIEAGGMTLGDEVTITVDIQVVLDN